MEPSVLKRTVVVPALCVGGGRGEFHIVKAKKADPMRKPSSCGRAKVHGPREERRQAGEMQPPNT